MGPGCRPRFTFDVSRLGVDTHRMSYEDVKKVWMNGRLVDFADAKIHSFSHVFHYGSAMFEGARVYKTKSGSAAFRLDENIKRLYDSCKIYRMEIPYSVSYT